MESLATGNIETLLMKCTLYEVSPLIIYELATVVPKGINLMA